MKERVFYCENVDGYQIYGKLYSQDDGCPHPTVICSHGFTSSTIETTRFALKVAEIGMNAVAFDFCGGGFKSQSEGSFEDYMTPITETMDLKSVYEQIMTFDEVDESKIYLLGCSQGGFVSSLVSSQVDIAGLILIYPALCIPDDARKGSMQIMKFDPNNIPDHIGTSPMRVSGDYPRSVIKIDIYQEIVKYHGPVFLAHGTDDAIVPFSYAEKANEAYIKNGNDIDYLVIEHGDHGFHAGNYFEIAVEGMQKFLKKHN